MRRFTFAAMISLITALSLSCLAPGVTASAEAIPQQDENSSNGLSASTLSDGVFAEYEHSTTAEGAHFKFTVSWNDPVAGQPLTLHCEGSGGSANYKYYLRSPKYIDPALGWDYVYDPSQTHYTNATDSYDFEFTPMATGTYELQIDCMNMDGSGFDPISVKITLPIDDPAYPSVGARVQNAVKQCNLETDGSDYQKAVWLHDWLIDQLEYDNTFLYSSAEAALCRGTGTCQAYMAAYQHLLNAVGIENREVRDEGDYHTWNAIKIDGNWCQVDCTWDDVDYSWQSIDMRHYYFGLTDELMGTAHPNFSDVYTQSDYATPSKSLANGYYVRSGEAKTWADAYAERIQVHLNNKEPEFSVTTDVDSWPESYKGIYNGYVAYELGRRAWTTEDGEAVLNVKVQGDSLVCTATYQTTEEETAPPKIKVQAHISNEGWKKPVELGQIAGATNSKNSLEALRLILPDNTSGAIEVRAHVSNIGWQDWTITDASAFAGTVGKSQAIEALQIRLNDKFALNYDIWYRVKSKGFGWSGWATNGASAGSQGYGKAIEAIEVQLIAKGDDAPGDTANTFRIPLLTYSAHVQKKGWMPQVHENAVAGTTGKSLNLEALRLSLGPGAGSGDILIRAHVRNIGWQDWASGTAGTTGKSLPIEALQIKLSGEAADKFDIWYRVHSADYGWLGWACNGSPAGSQSYSKSAQAVEIKLLPKGSKAPGSTSNAFKAPTLKYASHSQKLGWSSGKTTAQNPSILLGTTGRGLSLEAFQLSAPGLSVDGSIVYSAHVAKIGWQENVSDGKTAGTTGRKLPIEAVKISLSGDLSEKYDVWYRAHLSKIGWLDWTSNGMPAGSQGLSTAVEAIEIKFLPKGSDTPGSTNQPFMTIPSLQYSSQLLGGS